MSYKGDNLSEMNQRLLPCPFCGGDAHLAWYNNGEAQIVVECENPNCLSAVCGSEKAEEAIERWNKRAKASKLKPCPFCGNRAELECLNNGECNVYQVICQNPYCLAETITSREAEDVINIWNRRSEGKGDLN